MVGFWGCNEPDSQHSQSRGLTNILGTDHEEAFFSFLVFVMFTDAKYINTHIQLSTLHLIGYSLVSLLSASILHFAVAKMISSAREV